MRTDDELKALIEIYDAKKDHASPGLPEARIVVMELAQALIDLRFDFHGVQQSSREWEKAYHELEDWQREKYGY